MDRERVLGDEPSDESRCEAVEHKLASKFVIFKTETSETVVVEDPVFKRLLFRLG